MGVRQFSVCLSTQPIQPNAAGRGTNGSRGDGPSGEGGWAQGSGHRSHALLGAGASACGGKFPESKEIPRKSDQEGTRTGTDRWHRPLSSGFSGPQRRHFPFPHIFLSI